MTALHTRPAARPSDIYYLVLSRRKRGRMKVELCDDLESAKTRAMEREDDGIVKIRSIEVVW